MDDFRNPSIIISVAMVDDESRLTSRIVQYKQLGTGGAGKTRFLMYDFS